MPAFEPLDPDFEERVRASFERQAVMKLVGAELVRVEPGLAEIALPYRSDLTQQHDYVHAGITTMIADSAGGYGAYSLMPAGSSILSVELKVNFLAPARGERFLARGRVLRPGARITTCEIEVEAYSDGQVTRCLFGLQTTLCLPAEPDTPLREARS